MINLLHRSWRLYMSELSFFCLNSTTNRSFKTRPNQSLIELQEELNDILNNRTEKNSWIENFKKYENIKTLSDEKIIEERSVI